MGRAESGPEFRVNFGSGRVTSHVGRLGQVKKIGPTSNSDTVCPRPRTMSSLVPRHRLAYSK